MNPTTSLDEYLDELEATQSPIKLTELQQTAIVKSIPSSNVSAKKLVKFLANNPDSTAAKLHGQTGIINLVEAMQIASQYLFKKGYFISHRLTDDELSLTEYWGIYQIPDHAKHCNNPQELGEYFGQSVPDRVFNISCAHHRFARGTDLTIASFFGSELFVEGCTCASTCLEQSDCLVGKGWPWPDLRCGVWTMGVLCYWGWCRACDSWVVRHR